jgi:AcrR family transcriptional regulator
MAAGDRSPRADHAARIRRSLLDAALELFSDQGYEETTTEQIAAVAGVSPRTFFRYFPTKESVLFFGEYDFVRSFAGLYLAQGPDVGDLTAMRTTFVTLAPGLTRLRGRIRLYLQAVASSPTLAGREQANHRENAATIARAIATRRGLEIVDEDATLMAEVGMLALQRAILRWSGDGRSTLAELLEEQFDRLESLLR